MIKLYKDENGIKQYWETWEYNGIYTVHWGRVGETGETTEIKKSLFNSPKKKISNMIDAKKEEGFKEIQIEDIKILLIEYKIEGMGTESDLNKRQRLEERMNGTLGWTGLGHCDGGSIGSGTMEVCCFVVDFEIAKLVIENDLKVTEFENYTRIFIENENN